VRSTIVHDVYDSLAERRAALRGVFFAREKLETRFMCGKMRNVVT
jgi:hypothetical protein